MVAPLAFAAFALLAPLQQQVAAPTGEVRGLVRSEATGERLGYSVIEAMGAGRQLFTMADSAGRYLLRDIPPGRHILRVGRFDHAPLEIEVLIPAGRGVMLDVLLVPRPMVLPGITAGASPRPSLADTLNPPTPELSVAATRALESTPGVIELGLVQVSQGSPGQEPVDPSDVLYVRGAPADLKLVLLDGAPVYAPFHIAGLIQAFDPEVLRSADLYLGGAPARYDGGLSYVLGLETRAGRRTGVHGSGSLDLLSTRALVEGPLVRRAGFLASGRAIHGRGVGSLLDGAFPYDYADALIRVDADVGGAGGIALTGFWNNESIRLDDASSAEVAEWGNGAGSLRYRGALAGAFAELTAAYGGYRARLPLGGAQDVVADGRARRARLSADLTHSRETTRIQYGISYERLAIDYDARPLRAVQGDELVLEATVDGAVAGAYLDVGWRPGERWRIRGGARADIFSSDGVARFAPRLSATWLASERASLTIAAGRYRQFIRSTEPVLVVDEDSTESLHAPPPLALARASHLVLSLDQDLGDGMRLGIEGFFKMFADVPRVDTTIADPGPGSFQTTKISAARASGLDLWLRRGEGQFTGWLGYSLGWVWADDGPRTTGRFAGRQILSVGLTGPLGRDGRFDVRVAYGAGLPYSAVPRVQSQVQEVLRGDVAQGGLPTLSNATINAPPLTAVPDDPYLRVDLEVSHRWTAEWGGRPVTFSPYLKVLNALDRRDALLYRVTGERGQPTPLAAFPLLPVLGFRWTF